MASLTETAYYARNTIKFGAIGIVVFFVLRAGVSAGVAYWKKLHPPPPPPPTVSFGQLPAMVFPALPQPTVTYTLETVTGATPDLGDRASVYFMPVRTASLLGLERTANLASKLEFRQKYEQLSPTRYRWVKNDPLPATLTADIISGSFTVEVAWNSDPALLFARDVPNETLALDETKNWLQNLGLLADDLQNGASKITYLRADINDLVKAVSLSEADFVRVDLFRAPIDLVPVYPANPDRGIVSIVFSGENSAGKRVVDVNYNYFPVTMEQSATYPIITTQEAWAKLQSGQGYIARLDVNVKNVVVRRISLGYYDSAIPQHFLQPIFIFEGDNNFVGYVQAINAKWIIEN